LRLLAESFTAGMYYGGGFLTNNLGRFFASFLPVEYMAYPAWWAYSTALGIFFVTLPYSRFMHIPTEVLLIFFRHWGIKTTNQPGSYSRFEVHSCPRCGVCLDACPVYSVKQNGTPPVYFLRTIRENRVEEKTTYDCLLCGRCQVYCPVGIDNNPIRIAQRSLFQPNGIEPYNYLAPPVAQKADVAYFAGCMTHLTPSVIRSMDAIFRSAGIEYAFLDANATICCGRPLMMAGKEKQAHMLREHNYRLIKASGCHTLVTSCPICYKVFQEDYGLTIRVLHHTQYLHELSHSGKLNLRLTDIRAVFHDPCELGRGSGIYEPPREVIRSMAHLVEGAHEKEDSVCCGGSLGNLEIKAVDRDGISQIALEGLISQNPEVIITACPLCKKTLQKNAPVKVADICEMAAANLIDQPQKTVRQLFCVMEFP
jgi:Fe-S oxidoreductase